MKWKFFKSAQCVQVKLENGNEIAALNELDQKLWTVLSASTSGLRFDQTTLKMLDTDGDGRIRAPEVLSAVDWLRQRFISLDFLFARRDKILLRDINSETAEGRELLESFKNILTRDNREDATLISLSDILSATKIFNDQPFNGDGIITLATTDNPELANAIANIIATEGAVKDRSGSDGVDKAKCDAFFANATSYLAWKADEENHLFNVANRDIATSRDATANAYKLYRDIKEIVDAYFTLPEDISLIAPDPTPTLSLSRGVNPKWKSKFEAFASALAICENLPQAPEEITREKWNEISKVFDSYGAWLDDARASLKVATLGEETLAKVLNENKIQLAIEDLITRDAALANESSRFADCERALRYAANLANWLCNYVNQANLYDMKSESVFRTGELYIDGRVCRLCFHVANVGAHSALAEKSKCCLLYVKLSRPATGETRDICAVVTAGSTASLYAGRNGIFYDCDGRDWDAVVAKVVEAQVSLREAFWAPWAKIATTISEQCKKFLSSKQDDAVAKVGEGATAAASQPAANPGANGAALASSVAALGVGVGMAGAACAGLIGLVAGLPLWKVFAGVVAIILLVSLPSVVLAWFKLRARDLGAILNACGWAVNRPLTFSMGLAKTFTHPAKMPVGATVSRDPYSSRKGTKFLIILLWILLAIGLLLATAFAIYSFLIKAGIL